MKTLNLSLPASSSLEDSELLIILAGELYEREKLTLGQAAELAGLTKRTFIEVMGKFGFSVFSDSEEELMSDIENA